MCQLISNGGHRCTGDHTPAQHLELLAHRRALRSAGQLGEVHLPGEDTADVAAMPAPTPTHEDSETPTVSTEAPITALTDADRVKAMKALRREICSDEAKPNAGLEWAQALTAQRVEAAGRGLSTDHNWSARNRTWLQLQVQQRGGMAKGWFAGSRQWDSQDRELLTGAQPYQIFRPKIFSKAEEPADDTDTAKDSETPTAPEKSRVRGGGGFAAVNVYDWSQTRRKDGQPDPSWSLEIPGGSEALYQRMITSSPLPVKEVSDGSTGTAHGYTDGRTVVIDSRRPVGDRIHTMAHELAHVQLEHVGSDTNRADAEQEAELTAYFVGRSLNLGTEADDQLTENSAAYLRSWSPEPGVDGPAGHKARWEIFEARADRASTAAAAIVARLLEFDVPEATGPTMQKTPYVRKAA